MNSVNNNNYANYEEEIDLIDLLFYLLRRWRPIMLAALLLAVILGAYKVTTGAREQQNTELVQEAKDRYEAEKAAYEQTKDGYERDIASLLKSIETQDTYLENSVLMKIDPFAKSVARADIAVSVNTMMTEPEILISDPADAYVKAYASALKSGRDMEQIGKELGIEANYIDELIVVDSDYASNTVSVSVSATDPEMADKILEQLLKRIPEQQEEIGEKMGLHEIQVLNRSMDIVMDMDLANTQKAESDRYTSYQKALTDKKKALKDLSEPSVPESISKKVLVKNGAKYALIGAIAGIVLVSGGFGVCYLVGGKLHTAEELERRYGVKVLGVLPSTDKKRLGSAIDQLIRKLSGEDRRKSESELVIRSSLSIRNRIETGKTVLITGTVEKEYLDGLRKQFEQQLPELHWISGEDMTECVKTVKTLKEKADGVLLVEAREKTKCVKLEEEVKTVREFGCEILGSILL